MVFGFSLVAIGSHVNNENANIFHLFQTSSIRSGHRITDRSLNILIKL